MEGFDGRGRGAMIARVMKLSEWLVERQGASSETSTVSFDGSPPPHERAGPVGAREAGRDDRPGAPVADRYSDLGEVGRGGTASVRRASSPLGISAG